MNYKVNENLEDELGIGDLMENRNIESYGYTDFYKEKVKALNIEDEELIPARVVAVHREQYKIVSEFGENSAKLKGSVFFNAKEDVVYPGVGDFVLIMKNPCGDDVIYKVIDRKSKFSRMDTCNGKEQLVACNFDYVFIMTSLNHDFNIKRLERYLTVAYESGAMPIIILTKADLCEDSTEYEEKLEDIAFGVPIIKISSLTGEGIDEIKNYVKSGKTVVFLGSSGVGKSSLVNAIAGYDLMKVNGIREDDSRGRHTTTHRQLIMLDSGAMIIDTPGMRELGMWDVSQGLNATFSDIEELESQCKFNDCKHKAEPGCAIKAALDSGKLSKERWENYKKLKKESQRAEQNITAQERKLNHMLAARSWGKAQAKHRKQVKKGVF